ncbi:4798_t:CDS:2, partial [Cetraspora pellucida]
MAMSKYKPFLYQYAVWAVFGSAAIHLLWTKNEYREYKERTNFKISKLEDLIEKLKRDTVIEEQGSSTTQQSITSTQPHVTSTHTQKEEKSKAA